MALRDRDLRRLVKLQRRFGRNANIGTGAINPKPKWMRHATYERLLEAECEAIAVVDAHLVGRE